MNFEFLDVHMRTLFQMHTIEMSVTVWVGFLALFGIATDNGVIQATYLQQMFRERKPKTTAEVHEAVIAAASRSVRLCLMTTATTIPALIPVLTSAGRGSDVMAPMAIPSFGGMVFELTTMFVVPVLYRLVEEARLGSGGKE